jgi:hypothetical protein
MYILSPRNQFVVVFFSVFDCLCYIVTLFAISQILHYMYLTNFALFRKHLRSVSCIQLRSSTRIIKFDLQNDLNVNDLKSCYYSDLVLNDGESSSRK